jgi:hypothetical protein
VCQFLVYEFEAYKNMAFAFDPFVGWVLDDCNSKWAGEDRGSQENDGTTGPLYKEISRFAVALAHLGEPHRKAHSILCIEIMLNLRVTFQ